MDSAPESHLRLLIHHAALPEPEVNQWITGPDGRVISRPDLQYRRLRIALEYEGEHHLLDPAQWHRDIERDDRLRQLGWVVLRFTKQHLRPENAPATEEKVRTALLARGWQPGRPT
ncbi:endonuclease domain-containing protein [Arthrobacter zhaoxinii]|uniref:Endonuclease domain-containing protein n=1 Tax=Arthrobacter zhaoxinii TaxID=2964616 RepID=A0ABY5YRX3_9MICC|nr:endonuclease domain-containing protein [Arthrobacter zhaoxinii]UWX97869.1 endonuclease domain-containing protein [Arthrobacter zhaoxinii]